MGVGLLFAQIRKGTLMSDFDSPTPTPPPGAGAPPPPVPPAPEGGSGGAGNPWERREQLGFGQAIIEGVKLFVTNPTEAFRQTRETGDYASPLIFAVLMGWLGAVISQVWSFLFKGSMLGMFPADLQDQVAPYLAGSGCGMVAMLVVAPIFVLIGLFIWSAILHLALLVVGGLNDSRSGFEGTFRVASYSTVSQLGNLVPIIGGLIALVWSVVLGVIGITRLHHTSQGKAVAAILLPLVLCCVCVVLGAVLFGVSIASFVASQGGG